MENGNEFRAIGATTYLSPIPAVLVGCADLQNSCAPNLITVAWAGICCTRPPMLGISLRKERYSYGLIERTREFTVNLISQPLCYAMDFCGVKSGRDVDKFSALGLTAVCSPPLAAAPAVGESPAHLSCLVKQILPLGSHDLFLAQIEQVYIGEEYFREDGSIDEGKMKLVSYVHGQYRAVGDELGFFGYSVAGEKALKRRGKQK